MLIFPRLGDFPFAESKNLCIHLHVENGMIDTERNAMYLQLLEDIRKQKRETNKAIDYLFAKLENLKVEEKSIEKLVGGGAAINNSARQAYRKHGKVKDEILSIIDTGEFSVPELCEKLGLDNNSYRSYFSQFYRTYKVGRRGFMSGGSHCYKYATEEWYKSQGITDYALHKNWTSEV